MPNRQIPASINEPLAAEIQPRFFDLTFDLTPADMAKPPAGCQHLLEQENQKAAMGVPQSWQRGKFSSAVKLELCCASEDPSGPIRLSLLGVDNFLGKSPRPWVAFLGTLHNTPRRGPILDRRPRRHHAKMRGTARPNTIMQLIARGSTITPPMTQHPPSSQGQRSGRRVFKMPSPTVARSTQRAHLNQLQDQSYIEKKTNPGIETPLYQFASFSIFASGWVGNLEDKIKPLPSSPLPAPSREENLDHGLPIGPVR